MFPLAHFYLAKLYFGKLTTPIKQGSMDPDAISAAIMLTFSHKSYTRAHEPLKKFKFQRYAQAYNLHILADNDFEEKYFLKYVPNRLKKSIGKQLGHAFVEAAYDLLLLEEDEKNYHSCPPPLDNKLIDKLGSHFKIPPLQIRIAENMLRWKNKKTYNDCVIKYLWGACMFDKISLVKSDIAYFVDECRPILEEKFLKKYSSYGEVIKKYIKTHRKSLGKKLSSW